MNRNRSTAHPNEMPVKAAIRGDLAMGLLTDAELLVNMGLFTVNDTQASVMLHSGTTKSYSTVVVES